MRSRVVPTCPTRPKGGWREMATMVAKRKPKPERRGHYALDHDDPRWFPMAQGEMFYQVVAWMVHQMNPPELRMAFVQGLVVKAGEDLKRQGYTPIPSTPAEQPTQPAVRRKRRG